MEFPNKIGSWSIYGLKTFLFFLVLRSTIFLAWFSFFWTWIMESFGKCYNKIFNILNDLKHLCNSVLQKLQKRGCKTETYMNWTYHSLQKRVNNSKSETYGVEDTIICKKGWTCGANIRKKLAIGKKKHKHNCQVCWKWKHILSNLESKCWQKILGSNWI